MLPLFVFFRYTYTGNPRHEFYLKICYLDLGNRYVLLKIYIWKLFIVTLIWTRPIALLNRNDFLYSVYCLNILYCTTYFIHFVQNILYILKNYNNLDSHSRPLSFPLTPSLSPFPSQPLSCPHSLPLSCRTLSFSLSLYLSFCLYRFW